MLQHFGELCLILICLIYSSLTLLYIEIMFIRLKSQYFTSNLQPRFCLCVYNIFKMFFNSLHQGLALFNLKRFADAKASYVNGLELDGKYEVLKDGLRETEEEMRCMPWIKPAFYQIYQFSVIE